MNGPFTTSHLTKCVSVAIALFAAVCTLHTNVTEGADAGTIKLCPAGGRTFVMAWSIACEMRRRRKRNAQPLTYDSKRAPMLGYRKPTLDEMKQICCSSGCQIRDLINYCSPFG